jgi:hypothetical protein
MRTLLLLIPLALIGCKPDPIEACVEAHKKKLIQEFKLEGDAETTKVVVTVSEPNWRLKCMEAASGRATINQNNE